MNVTIVAANTFQFDSRQLRTASALAADGHRVRLIGFGGPGLPAREVLADGIELHRIVVDGTIASALRPLPQPARRAVCRLLGIDPAATSLPPGRATGLDRLRAPVRRFLEVAAHARRVGPWSRAVVGVAGPTDVFHCKALIALPVIRSAARATGARFVYDIADIHTEAARLARMPGWFRALVRGRERAWVLEAAGLTAVSDDVADEVVRRFGVARPAVVLNCPPAWRPGEGVPPRSGRLRALAGVPDGRPIVLYQGGFSVDRGIEELVAAIDEPPLAGRDVAAVFVGYGRLHAWLTSAAARRPGRVVVVDAIAPDALLEYTVDADVGYVGQPPRTLNQRLNLANKLFEYLQTAVPVVVSDGTAHCRLVTDLALGRCVDIDAPPTIGAAIVELLDLPASERAELRAHVRQVASERFTWERQQVGLVGLYRSLARGEAGAPAAT